MTFDQQASDAARIVVEACGENPGEVTAAKMDEIDCRLQCTRCRGHKAEKYVVNWRQAVSSLTLTLPRGSQYIAKVRHEVVHLVRPHLFMAPPGEAKWRLVTDPEDLALVYAAEKTAIAVTPFISCKACRARLQNNGSKSDLEMMQWHWKG